MEIARVESLPWSLRFRWGALKNLLCGVTTVAHHGAGVSALPGSLSPVNLVVGTAVHSVRLDPHWRRHVLSPTAQAPLVFHLGEGVNDESRREIEAVIRWNLWRRRIVAVHGIAMTEDQAPRFDAVVWCPVSNELLFGATANVAALKRKTRILFGTDSTLTGGWNIWQHLRRAREIGGLDDRELFDAVTTAAARTWGDAGGQLDAGHRADLVVARMKHPGAWDSFYAIDPEDLLLVIGAGRVLVADDTVENVAQLGLPYAIRLGSSIKRVAEDLSPMLKEIQGRGLLANLPLGLA